MTDLTIFREYEPWELGRDGYPVVWHRNDGDRHPQRPVGPYSGPLDDAINAALDRGLTGLDFRSGVKHLVRAEAGHRCLRCRHPFLVGETGSYEPVPDGDPDKLGELGRLFYSDDRDGLEPPPGQRNRSVHWSPCDEQCTHADPVRGRRFTTEPLRPIAFTEEWSTAGEFASRMPEVEAAWRILTVHHLNERKHDLRWWNLAALCQRCHLTIQRKVTMEAVYPLEHTDWFKPYAAGWYAYAYLGENLTREAVEQRMDALLGLERMA